MPPLRPKLSDETYLVEDYFTIKHGSKPRWGHFQTIEYKRKQAAAIKTDSTQKVIERVYELTPNQISDI